MWSRRRFIESVAALPIVGGIAAAAPAPVAAAGKGGRDYFRELGVRPFINAAGTYTAMTASLMAPEVDGGHQLRLEALRDARRAPRPGRRAHRGARACRGGDGHVGGGFGADAGHGGRAHGDGPAEDRRPAESVGSGRADEERRHHPEGPPLRLRARRPQLRGAAGGGGDARRSGARGQRRRPR